MCWLERPSAGQPVHHRPGPVSPSRFGLGNPSSVKSILTKGNCLTHLILTIYTGLELMIINTQKVLEFLYFFFHSGTLLLTVKAVVRYACVLSDLLTHSATYLDDILELCFIHTL